LTIRAGFPSLLLCFHYSTVKENYPHELSPPVDYSQQQDSNHQGEKKTRQPNSTERRRKRRSMERKKAPLFPCPDPQRIEWLPQTEWLVTQTLRNVTEQLHISKESRSYLS